MDRYLLDTHTAIWFFNGDKALSKTAHLTVLEKLPLLHRDPFDRLLIATAISEQMTFISADKNVAQYDVPLVW